VIWLGERYAAAGKPPPDLHALALILIEAMSAYRFMNETFGRIQAGPFWAGQNRILEPKQRPLTSREASSQGHRPTPMLLGLSAVRRQTIRHV